MDKSKQVYSNRGYQNQAGRNYTRKNQNEKVKKQLTNYTYYTGSTR